jgi:hypothetical protein
MLKLPQNHDIYIQVHVHVCTVKMYISCLLLHDVALKIFKVDEQICEKAS